MSKTQTPNTGRKGFFDPHADKTTDPYKMNTFQLTGMLEAEKKGINKSQSSSPMSSTFSCSLNFPRKCSFLHENRKLQTPSA